MPIHKSVNKNFFKIWSQDMAYVLGFFFADGSYDINLRGSEYFSFQITDKELLMSIRNVLSSNHTIAKRLRSAVTESTQYRLQIGSKEMCSDLRRLGVSTQKAFTIKFPDMPNKFFPDFIRGYFDGDGHVWLGEIHKSRITSHWTLQSGFTSCSEYFLRSLHVHLQQMGIVGGGVYCKKGGFCIKYSTSDSLELYRIMYSSLGGTDLFLQRKKKVFEKYARFAHSKK
ncbi:MAG: intein-encoded DNA endonuclease-like protein [Candidatus Azotimanducaceae bacterium]|jgi:intein-encoded DNA endonuclease-like protein